MNDEQTSLESKIKRALQPPPASNIDCDRFTREVIAGVRAKTQRKAHLLFLVPMTCCLVWLMVSQPVEEIDQKPGLVSGASTRPMAQQTKEIADPLTQLWTEHLADLSLFSEADLENDFANLGSLNGWGWMPSHYQEFSELLGLTNKQEETL